MYICIFYLSFTYDFSNYLFTIMKYSYKDNKFEPEKFFSFEKNALCVKQAERLDLIIPFSEFISITLEYKPTRYKLNQYLMTLKTKAGYQLEIMNYHYAGLADFEDRSTVFKPFVIELIHSIKESNPKLTILTGVSKIKYFAYLILTLFTIAMLLALFPFIVELAYPGILILHLISIALMLPYTISYLIKNYPRRIEPKALSFHLLPKA